MSQLRLGENVLWHAPESAAVRDAAHADSQRGHLMRAMGSAALGSLCTWWAYIKGRAWLAEPDISSALAAPIMLVLAILLLSGCLIFVRFLVRGSELHGITSTWHAHYVLTDQRLFYVDAKGELIDEIEGPEIVTVDISEKPRPATVLVERRNGNDEDKHLILTNLEQPLVAKSKITETFLEPAP